MKTQATNTMAQRSSAAPKQSLAPRQQAAVAPTVTYKDDNGVEISLSTDIIKNYLCHGAKVSDADALMFLNICQYQGLNPWTGDAYLVCYGSTPSIITGKNTFTKRAQHNPNYQGINSGVSIINRNGVLEDRKGEIVLDGETLVGGWAEVYMKDYVVPLYSSVSFTERCQYKDGKPSGKWATAPALMIRKCAIVSALRDAMPDKLGGLYSAEEMGYEEVEANTAPIPQPAAQRRDHSNAIDIEPLQEEEIFDGEEAMESIFGDE